MTRLLCLCLLIYGALPVLSTSSAETMTYIEYKYRSELIKPGSFEATTRKLWRVGRKYLRLQEEPDPSGGIHGLIIADSPNSYLINLYTMKGQHIVDPGPTFDVLVPVLAGEKQRQLLELQMGEEFEFFGNGRSATQHDVVIAGAKFDRYTRKFGDTEISMLSIAGTRTPFRISLKSPKAEYSLEYLKYETGRDVDLDLFKVPPGVRLHRPQ